MRLESKDGQPEIKWRNEDYSSIKGQSRRSMSQVMLLVYEKRKRQYSENGPNAEIDGKVAEVEVPGLRSVYIWTSARAREDVVADDVQGYTSELLVKEAVDTNFEGL